jgi:hypothetical protein
MFQGLVRARPSRPRASNAAAADSLAARLQALAPDER